MSGHRADLSASWPQTPDEVVEFVVSFGILAAVTKEIDYELDISSSS
jgi:hypothetical protein